MEIAEAIRAWSEHVQRLAMEGGARQESRDAWGMDDLVAALYLRDAVDEAAGAALAPDLKAVLASADTGYLDYTRPDVHGDVARYAGGQPDTARWWWSRAPRLGLPARELEEWRERGEPQMFG